MVNQLRLYDFVVHRLLLTASKHRSPVACRVEQKLQLSATAAHWRTLCVWLTSLANRYVWRYL